MPLTSKGNKIMRSMKKEYGPKEGEKVFYASRNKGTISGVENMKMGGMCSTGNDAKDLELIRMGKGGNPGQWSARKAQMLAKAYKKAGGGYK